MSRPVPLWGRASSVRLVLLAGFAVVFGLWLLWGYELLRGLREIESTVSAVQQSYARGEQILLRLRTNVLLSSIYIRDALIDAALLKRDYYRGELEHLRAEGDQLLQGYIPQVTSAAERDEWRRLERELQDYWTSREIAFSSTPRTAAQSAALLRTRIVPRRETILEIIDSLGELQASAAARQQRELESLYNELRGRLLSIGAVTIVVALLVAATASRHVSRLQRQLERQRLNEQENRRDLERLSARLVDVQERERRSLARELHDAVGQALTAVKMDIGIALRSDARPRVRSALEEAREIVETTLRGVRDLSQLLHPSTLDDFGLPATLTAHLRRFTTRTGIRTHLHETLPARLQLELEVCVYRIVQEALNNVAQHSGARMCDVTLAAVEGLLHLSIEDDGAGVGRPRDLAASSRGLGLIAMRERAQTFGGTFLIETRSEGGTRVRVTLPLDPAIGKPATLRRIAG